LFFDSQDAIAKSPLPPRFWSVGICFCDVFRTFGGCISQWNKIWMNVLRKNTDYALRMMGNLAGNYGQKAVSVRMLARQEDVSYQFACKILQKLQGVGLVESMMGPAGGYRLCLEPEKITMLDVIRTMQGNVAVNRCTDENDNCPRQANCPVSRVLCRLQRDVDEFFVKVTLKDLLNNK